MFITRYIFAPLLCVDTHLQEDLIWAYTQSHVRDCSVDRPTHGAQKAETGDFRIRLIMNAPKELLAYYSLTTVWRSITHVIVTVWLLITSADVTIYKIYLLVCKMFEIRTNLFGVFVQLLPVRPPTWAQLKPCQVALIVLSLRIYGLHASPPILV